MSQLLRIYQKNSNTIEIKKAVSILKKGGVIIYPTDTVYGLGCDITNLKALERIAKLKQVRLDKANFSFICYDLSNLSDYVSQIEKFKYKILKRSLPGAYTFILNGNNKLPRVFKKKKTVGIRIPDNFIAREIVRQLENPIVSTSIYNNNDKVEYTTDPGLIYQKWYRLVDLVIDGGCGGNVASTVVDLTQDKPKIIREGKGALEVIFKTI